MVLGPSTKEFRVHGVPVTIDQVSDHSKDFLRLLPHYTICLRLSLLA